MLDFPRWKVWLVSLTVLAGILLAIPSLLPKDQVDRWPAWLPSARINLGLDIAGGSQLLLEADIADAAKQRLQAMEDTVTTELRRGEPRIAIGDVSTSGGRLSFVVRDPTQHAAAFERMRQLTQPVGLTGSRDWEVTHRRRQPDRPDADRIGRQAGADQFADRCPRRGPPPNRSGRNQGNHGHQPGRPANFRPGARRRGSRSAEAADRPDRAARVQAGRSHRRSAAGSRRPGTAGKPGPADGRRHRRDRRPAPRDGVGRAAGRRQAGLRPGRPGGRRHHLQRRRRPPLRPGDAGKCRQAVRHHPRRQGAVGTEHQRTDPRRPGADQRQLHRRKRQPAGDQPRFGQAAGEAERGRGAHRQRRARQGFDRSRHHRLDLRDAGGDRR